MTLVDTARSLMQAGRIAEAERAYQDVLDSETGQPGKIEALNVLALAALRDGRNTLALELLQHATTSEPADAVSFHHLGHVYDARSDLPAALASYRRAVQLRPDFFVARLHYASVLERSGESLQATTHYARSLRDAQHRGQWLNPDTTPVPLRQLVERAVEQVRHGRQTALYSLLEPLQQRYGRESLVRVMQCLRIYLGEQQAVYQDDRQRPTFLYFPQLPATAYFDRALFPWIAEFEAYTPAIREELLRLLPSAHGRERVFTDATLERTNLRGTDNSPSWNGYYFFRHGERRDENCAMCPHTAQALQAVPLGQIRQHAPEVFFSVFTAGTHLLPHHGVTNTRVVAHLPLLIPNDCALSVGGELHVWQAGRVVIFDDTYAHQAWNRSQQTRVVLIFDVWNPWLTEVERLAIADIVATIGDLRHAIDQSK